MPALFSKSTLLTLSLLSPLAHAAEQAQSAFYLTLYSVPGVPRTDDPYTWSTAGGRQLSKGLTNEEGRAFVKPAEGEENYVLETVSMRWNMAVPAKCWQGEPSALQKCAQLMQSASRYDIEQDAAKLLLKKTQAQLQVKAEAYAVAARANQDELAWLGRLPAAWSMDDYGMRLLGLVDRIQGQISKDIKAGGADVRQFVCRAPASYGPLPQQAAVDAWSATARQSQLERGGPAWDALVAAAAKGNWMARAELYYALAGRNVSELSYLEQYRIVQLMEWLHKQQIGALYSLLNIGYAAVDYGAGKGGQDQVYAYAAMRGSYADQYSVGTRLQTDTDPALAQAGDKMVACAKAARPDLR